MKGNHQNKQPLVSIIVPCYNQARFLDEALNSVLSQIYSNWECLIIDDGSLDNTKEISTNWISKDVRFKYFKKENGGLPHTRNFGISKAKGELILPLDADDKIGEKYLTLATQKFQLNQNLKLVYSNAKKFGDVNEFWELKEFSLLGLSRENMIFCSALFKKSDWEEVGGYDENMVYGWEDWEFWISILKDGGNVEKIDEVCFYYRIKEDSMLLRIDEKKAKILLEYLSIKHADFFVKYYGSFMFLQRKNDSLNQNFESKMRSEKFVLNAFTSRLFGFKLFKKVKMGIE